MNQCEDRSRRIPGRYGFLRVQCGRTIGTRQWRDTSGRDHVACAAHFRALESRNPIAEPDWLPDEPVVVTYPDPIDWAKWDADRSETWTLA